MPRFLKNHSASTRGLPNRASSTVADTTLSRTGDSSSLRNCHDESRREMSRRSCFACLWRPLGISVMGISGHQLQHSPGGHPRPAGLAAPAGLGQEMETHSPLAGVRPELLSPAVRAARGTRAEAIGRLEGRSGKERTAFLSLRFICVLSSERFLLLFCFQWALQHEDMKF